MLTKGSIEYKKAQKLANQIFIAATTGKEYGQIEWDESQEMIEDVVENVISKASGFAVEVAKTVKNTIKNWGFGYRVASCSSKQSWVLACAVVENGIEF